MPGERDGDVGGEESWAQTLITVTPEEDASIRTISGRTMISASGETPLDLGVGEIAERRRVHFNAVRRDLDELENETGYYDKESQTFLQGVPEVVLPISFKEEATQTFYLQGNPKPLRDIASIMNERPMPSAEKKTEGMQTVLTFDPKASRDSVVDGLKDWMLVGKPDDEETASRRSSASTLATDGLYFILERVFWLTDADYRVPEVGHQDSEAQTSVKVDRISGKIFLDGEVQTLLSCEPRRSNAGLLSEWTEATEFAKELLEECLDDGVLPRIVAESLVEEIIDRCASEIKAPSKDEIVQTIAACNAIEDGDEEVLRKLRLEIIVDTLESTIIILPIVNLLIEKACDVIKNEAPIIANDILNRVYKNSISKALKIEAIRREAVESRRPLEEIFEARKQRIRESFELRKAGAKLNSGTQTGLAGVPDIEKVKEPRETICSICARHSECYACTGNLDVDDDEGKARQKMEEKIHQQGTRDILIAYNPCYIVATPSEIANRLSLNPEPPKASPIIPPAPKHAPISLLTSSSASERLFDARIRGSRKAAKRRTEGGVASSSLDDWAKVARETSSSFGGWSIRGSQSSAGERVGSSSTCPNSRSKISTDDRSLPIRSANALRILKNTFNRCERDSCSDCSTRDDLEDREEEDDDKSVGSAATEENKNRLTISGGKLIRESKSGEDEGVRVIPIIHLKNRIDDES